MSRRNRPSAFDVSFPEEAGSSPGQDTRLSFQNSVSRSSSVSSHGSNPLKRKSDNLETTASPRIRPKATCYDVSRDKGLPEEIKDSVKFVLEGEDADENEEDKPVRTLNKFTIYDPKHKNELVPLSSLEEEDGVDREFVGVGYVLPYVFEEDEGQEEVMAPVRLKLGAIMRFSIDYTKANEPMYIETSSAWYILQDPSDIYRPIYDFFIFPHKVAQIVISWCKRNPKRSYDEFKSYFIDLHGPSGRTFEENDIKEAISVITNALFDTPEGEEISTHNTMKHIHRSYSSSTLKNARLPRSRPLPKMLSSLGQNPDLAVLKPENQNSTTVTPLIASLAEGLVSEELQVISARPRTPHNHRSVLEEKMRKERDALWKLIQFVHSAGKRTIDYKKSDRIAPGSNFLNAIQIDRETYMVGDYVLFRAGDWGNVKAPKLPRSELEIPKDASIPDYFWFAKIIHIKQEESKVHVQWLEHGKQTLMGELAHPQELFLDDLCVDRSVQEIVGKVTVHDRPKPEDKIEEGEYFYKCCHNQATFSFTSIDNELLEKASMMSPPDNCPVCLLQCQQRQDMTDQLLRDTFGTYGVTYAGKKYHLEDFVLYRSEGTAGPAHIGKIKNITVVGKNSEPKIMVVKVGRISSIPQDVLPENIDRDERHIFLTKEKTVLELKELVCVVYCYSHSSFAGSESKLSEWLAISPYHFYLKYEFPSFDVNSWSKRKAVQWQDLPVCKHCCLDNIAFRKDLIRFRKVEGRQNPMKTLDLFGGVGAFSRSLAEGSQCLKVTHAIEIGPSAAKTFKRNSPDTTVYNQCANEMLRYAVKSDAPGILLTDDKIPNQLYDQKEKVPSPPKPGDIDIIVAGFPCQSHSDLNMYKKANDVKSNLIFNTLSWQDFLRPKISYYENVPGFLNFRLNAQQVDQYNVTGGIEKGGLKFTVRALLDMGYQVRYGLLEAGHYGTPQRRVRFFIIAALENYPLPELPQPSHQFNQATGLKITLPSRSFCPIRMTEGVCPHPFVTIDDAISDLPRFDWAAPGGRQKNSNGVFVCDKKTSQFCGFKPEVVPNYHHRAKTTYQKEARKIPTTNLQQFTKTVLPVKVKRVIAIPLKAGADYRQLPPDLVEWQTTNQMSSIARKNQQKGTTGPYGRLDKDRVFPTTVTNMDPTAKQNQVLNPYCKRIVTVRELARSQGFPDSFVFEAVDNSVVTMHRQIGNAVPLPVGRALGRELGLSLYRKWKTGTDNAIVVDDSSDDESDQDRNAMQVDVVDDDRIDVIFVE